MRTFTSWPKILGALVGGLGLSVVFSAWMLGPGAEHRLSRITCDWWGLIVAGLLLIMSYLLAAGWDWARRILLVTVIVLGVYFLLRHGIGVIGPTYFTDVPPDEIPTVQFWTRLNELSSFFMALALVLFGMCFLTHPDVVDSFRRRARSSEKV